MKGINICIQAIYEVKKTPRCLICKEIIRCWKKCKKSTEESQTPTECPAVFPAGPSLYGFKNMREKLGQKNHNRIRMGAGNKWGKWNTNEGVRLEMRMKNEEGERGVDGVRCLRRSPEAWNESTQPETNREEREGSIRNRKRDSVNTGEEVEMNTRKQHEKERKGKESWTWHTDEEINIWEWRRGAEEGRGDTMFR